ncbi:hypothetical protein TUBRATIS_17270 [Tubulinosema ratisbonensis]|uniref:Uncharacterized protein n=1 Tax=Tubulinosema ratisbonensis TaxID=291195 RepID=A0A437AKT6_9MICR|nr:hypothetical protein TUBRATIS_17270 [Tubulinosema ratisbonensis]
MLREKLNELKKLKKTSELSYKPKISFLENLECDTEVLLEQITFPSLFLEEYSELNPEHLKQTELHEFKIKIHKELLNLYKYLQEESFEFYLEYLLLKYKLDLFAPSHLAFFLMPLQKYFKQFKVLDQCTHNFFSMHEFYSLDVFKKLYQKNALFRNNFIAYFDGVEEIEEVNLFIKAVSEK